MFSAAEFDAYNSIVPAYTPYLTSVPGARGASIDAAVAQAGRDVLVSLYPKQQAEFDSALTTTLARVPDGFAERNGIRVGKIVAAALLAERQGDGSEVDVPYSEHPGVGHWRPDPLHPDQKALTPGWGKVEPFALTRNDQFLAPPPPALTSIQYALAYAEVKSLGGDGVTTPTIRTPEQTQIGIFWGYDGSPGIGTPPRLYNQIARTIAEQMDNPVGENARLFALVNLAMADAGIESWRSKYDADFWRPVAGIRAGANDGNPFTRGDPNWAPLGAPASNNSGTNFTPPFPAYTSGHATFGAALFRTLARFYGRNNIAFTIGSDEFNGITLDQDGSVRPVVFRSYRSFSQAAQENALSRIYLGIHWRFDATEGIRQGNAIADYVFTHTLRPRHSGRQFGEIRVPGTGVIDVGDTPPSPNAALVTDIAPLLIEIAGPSVPTTSILVGVPRQLQTTQLTSEQSANLPPAKTGVGVTELPSLRSDPRDESDSLDVLDSAFARAALRDFVSIEL
jgi:hypothetical protein